MSKRSSRNNRIIFLAYMYRYVEPILMMVVPMMIGGSYAFLITGIGCILFALHGLIGYLCCWKHIGCSFQNLSHQKMKPDDIRWHKIRESDAYGIPAFWGVWGIAMIILHIMGYI